MIAWLVVGFLSGNVQAAAAQPTETRLVIGAGVVCRAQPDRAAPAVLSFRLGQTFTVQGIAQDRMGTAWYELAVRRSVCFVFGPLTVAWDRDNPDAALTAIADHALELEDASFEHLVAVDNLLIERKRRPGGRFAGPAALPPLLELRHLQIVDRAARKTGGRLATERRPLTLAWVLAHTDVVTYFEPGGLYHVRGSHFWALYERHRASPVAEEIAWVAAEAPVFTDECFVECHLSVLAQSYLSYWSAFPRGNHVSEAIATGVRLLERGARYCPLVAGDYLQERHDEIRTLARRVRDSVDLVSVSGRDDLLRHLSEIEATCLGDALDLKSPRAIPELVKALGSGFIMVSRQLAAFGEEAAPAVLDVVTSSSSNPSVVEDGLRTLRFVVEAAGPGQLSVATIERLTQAAERWLVAPYRSIGPVGAAIDLAAVLSDPDLRRILETLASDPGAIASRDTDDGTTEWIRKRAAERLAGLPPLPRP